MSIENLPLHLKYRPQNFEEFAGNESTVASLQSVLARKTGIPQAFLFHGSSGCGKTTLARIVMKRLGVEEFDLKEVNAADTNGIDTIREIAATVSMSPMAGSRRGYILDESHSLTSQAQNALLKTLEEPPSHVVFIICTTDPQKLIKTILSRCTQYKVDLLSDKRMTKLIKDICKKEGVEEYPDTVITEIVKVAEGSPRSALKILDQVIDIVEDDKAIKAVNNFKSDESTIEDICKEMAGSSPQWSKVQKILLGFNGDPEAARRAILVWLTNTLLHGRGDPVRLTALIDIFSETYFSLGKAGLIRDCYYGSDPDR